MAMVSGLEGLKKSMSDIWNAAFQGLNVRDYFKGFTQEINDSAEFVSKMVMVMEHESVDPGVISTETWGNIAADVRSVPEPTTIVLLGLGGLAMFRRRQKA